MRPWRGSSWRGFESRQSFGTFGLIYDAELRSSWMRFGRRRGLMEKIDESVGRLDPRDGWILAWRVLRALGCSRDASLLAFGTFPPEDKGSRLCQFSRFFVVLT